MQVQLVLMKLVPVLVVVMVLFDSISGTAITTQVLVVVMVLFDSISGTAITTQVLLMNLLHSTAASADSSTSTAINS